MKKEFLTRYGYLLGGGFVALSVSRFVKFFLPNLPNTTILGGTPNPFLGNVSCMLLGVILIILAFKLEKEE